MSDQSIPESDLALTAELATHMLPLGIAVAISTENASQNTENGDVLDFYRGSQLAIRARLTETNPGSTSTRIAAAKAIATNYWSGHLAENTVEQMAMRMEQAYDQAHLLFRLAQIPENAEASLKSLSDAMNRLLGITNLGWTVLLFRDSKDVVEALRGKVFLEGTPPIEKGVFDSLLREAQADGKPVGILRGDQSELAHKTGSEVLIHVLSFEGKRIGMLAGGNNGGVDTGLSSFETQLFAACGGYLDTFHANLARIARQEAMFLGTLCALTASIDAKDPYTRGHSERVALLAHDMAMAMGLGPAAAERYRIAGLIHDVGKIGVPEVVLCKAGKLTDDEFAFIRKHPQIGFDILRDIPGLEDIRPGVLHHHERHDGRGYPNRISGEEIPRVARVLALADTFDAMSSNRSYRAKLPREAVLAEIRKCAGGQFDPELAEIFVNLNFSRFDEALKSHALIFPNAPVVLAAA